MGTNKQTQAIDNDKKVMERLSKLIVEEVWAKELAVILTRFKNEAIRMYLESDDKDFVNDCWISDGYYYLTRVCETLDPYIEQRDDE